MGRQDGYQCPTPRKGKIGVGYDSFYQRGPTEPTLCQSIPTGEPFPAHQGVAEGQVLPRQQRSKTTLRTAGALSGSPIVVPLQNRRKIGRPRSPRRAENAAALGAGRVQLAQSRRELADERPTAGSSREKRGPGAGQRGGTAGHAGPGRRLLNNNAVDININVRSRPHTD